MHDRTVCQNAYCTFKINALYYMESYLIFKKTFKFKAKTKPNQQNTEAPISKTTSAALPPGDTQTQIPL